MPQQRTEACQVASSTPRLPASGQRTLNESAPTATAIPP
jgi:hypothetical protein